MQSQRNIFKIILERKRKRLKKNSTNSKVKCEIDQNILKQQQSIVCGLEAMSHASTKGRSNTTASISGSTYRNATITCNNELDVAISDFIYSKGLPFSICDLAHFKRLLKLVKFVTKEYKVPNRNRMSSDLLDQSYTQRIIDYK